MRRPLWTKCGRNRPHEEEYASVQRWLRTCLAHDGLRTRVPKSDELSARPFTASDPEIEDAVREARAEIDDALEYESDRADALERLG